MRSKRLKQTPLCEEALERELHWAHRKRLAINRFIQNAPIKRWVIMVFLTALECAVIAYTLIKIG